MRDFADYYRTNSPGVYVLLLDNYGAVDVFGARNAEIIRRKMTNKVLYIGKASNLSQRIENSHLRRARTSTLRRTIGDLLNMDFIRVSGKRSLNPEDEEIITEWLEENTYFKILETRSVQEAEKIEEYLITKLQPPLNKNGCRDHF